MTTINAVGVGLSGSTGSGSFVGSTSPTLVTPALGTPASGTLTNCHGYPVPTVQTFTSGSGTYTKPANVNYINVIMVGGGGGGGGSGTTGFSDGTAGASTTFGSSLLTCTGGALGSQNVAGGLGGAGTINSPAYGFAITGGSGGSGAANAQVAVTIVGGHGGSNPLGGGAFGGNSSGGAGATNTGAGGGGGSAGGAGATTYSGAGGGAGGYINAFIASPSATYSYSVGAAGSAGNAGTSGSAGGAGAAGIIIVIEYY